MPRPPTWSTTLPSSTRHRFTHASKRPHTSNSASKRPQGSNAQARPAAASAALEAALDEAARRPEVTASFSELGLPAALIEALAGRGITAPFAIQTRALPDARAGRDVLGRAQTGSGKTLAFGLPVLARLHDVSARRTASAPRALVLVPTRELARQVAEELVPLARPLRLWVTTVYGGAPMGRQIDQLRRGADVVVATPGRLIDLMERGAISLDAIEVAVLDEADHMADLGFLPAVTQILDATPATRQTMLFSATLDRGVDRLVSRYLRDPAFHAVTQSFDAAAAMDHLVFNMTASDKVTVAAEIARRPARTLFFVRTKHGADRLTTQLDRLGVEARALHGNLNQNQRHRALDAFASGNVRVLVATDVAARGIHVDDVDLVVHYDVPNDHKDYLHRSGRTARAGAAGTVVAFVQPDQVRDFARLQRAAGVEATTTSVRGGHPAVREVAQSGVAVTPIKPMTPVRPAQSTRPTSSGRPAQPGRRRPRNGRTTNVSSSR